MAKAKAKAKKRAKKPGKHPHVGRAVRWLHSAARGYMSGVVTEHRGDHAVVTMEDGSRVVRNVGEYELLDHSATAEAPK